MPALPASPTLSQPPPLDSAKPPNDESDVNVRRGPSSVWFRKRPARNVEDRPPIKRALLIAFNYENRKGEGWALQTNEDAVRVADLLKRRFGYLEENIKRITDRQEQAEALHSRVTVRREMLNFVSGVRPGDQLFFYFAGHGDQVANFTGTETDDHDEEICTPTHDFDPPVWPPTAPIDRLEEGLRDDELKDDSHLSAFSKATGKLKDNILHKILVRKLPAGCRLTALIDACNSGTMLGTLLL
ncbi:hypothetical protein SISSUDRAFT_1047291 [Sistotremastrum suecicum HHB10207 ss-3]|uniref:Peptidase C14 caspase domain-containing protein n=1 Tax=Sistotremastrum suecicum HHB10207 ss-3 TaxID=1314776 RepID=A0A166D7E9_9AGAM|nr:hypothetical protein SISSUDRAFT_1047291 [Sistotremastrum suecicum HHB10207 ss-3]